MTVWPAKIWRGFSYLVWWVCHEWLYDLAWYVYHIMEPFVAEVEIEGFHNVPRKGPVIMTANHMSQWDIFFIHNLMPRPGFFMTKIEYFGVFFLGGLVKLLGAFPVNRGKYDRTALQYALDLLNRGQQLVIFPEGTRSKDYQLQLIPNGAALLASRTGAQVVPIAFAGTETISRKPSFDARGKKLKPKVLIRVGQPYCLPRTDQAGRKLDLDQLSDLMMSKIAELLPPEYQGAYSPENIAARRSQPSTDRPAIMGGPATSH